MKKYILSTAIENASGIQRWTVDANSPEAALKIFKAHGGEFLDEEIEVTSLCEPEVIGQIVDDEEKGVDE